MSTANKSFSLLLYNTQNLPKDLVKQDFAIRRKQFQTIWEDLLSSTMEHSEQHYIVQGLRGSGKTMLLLKLYYAVEDDEQLQKWLIPILFKEEEYAITSLDRLWETIAQDLEDHPLYSSLFKGLPDELEDSFDEDNDDHGRLFYSIIEKTLKKHQKKILLFIENFGDTLGILSAQEEKVFREILMESSQIRIVASSSKSLEANYDYAKPFYQFFKVVTLKGLQQKEASQFLLKLGEVSGPVEHQRIKEVISTEKAKIEALRRLTDGIPRTMVLLFEIFLDGALENSYAYLEKMLDGVTPLYKHRMEDLPASQRPIVNAMALHWDGLTAKELAEKTKLSTKLLSAHLKKLEKSWVVDKVRQKTSKNYIYSLKERFFNIWYLMRYGRRRDQKRVRWLTQFLEIWCSEAELVFRTEKFIQTLQVGKFIPEGAVMFASAMSQVKSLEENLRNKLLYETIVNLMEQGYFRHAKEFAEIHSDSVNFENIALEWIGYEKFEEIFLLFIKNEKVFADKNVLREGLIASSCYILGVIYIKLKKYKEAEKYYLLAIEKGDVNSLGDIAALYSEHFKQYEKAKNYYLLAIEKGSVNALYNLANLYKNHLKQYEEAKKYFLLSIEKGDVNALNDIGALYLEHFNDYEKATKYYQLAAEKGNVNALSNLGMLYWIDQPSEAEKYYLLAIEKGDLDSLFWLASLYHNLQQYEKAEKYYLLTIEKGNEGAILPLAFIYQDNLKQYKKAEKYYLLILKKGISPEPIRNTVLHRLALLYDHSLKKYKQAEKYYLLLIEKKGTEKALLNLIFLYLRRVLKESKKKALKIAQKSIEVIKEGSHFIIPTLIFIWNDEFEVALKTSRNFLANSKFLEEEKSIVTWFFSFLLAKKQYHATLNILKEYQLEEQFKPVYYALMHFLKDEYPNETLRMGEEIKETVNELLEQIKEMAEEYK